MEHYNTLVFASIGEYPVDWVKSNGTHRESYENTKHALEHLSLFIKECTDPEQWTIMDKVNAVDAVRVCMIYDRVNALYKMKVDHMNPDCPVGIPWVTKNNLKGVPPSKKDGFAMKCHSITSHYMRFARMFFSEEQEQKNDPNDADYQGIMKQIIDLHGTEYPKWWNAE